MAHPTRGALAPASQPAPIVGATHDTLTKSMDGGDARSFGARPVRITVDGRVVAPGPQTARALALLGIDEAAIDANWFSLLLEVHAAIDAYALEHQAGMGWQVDVDIAQDGVTDVADLAYIDPRSASREVTYRVRQWSPPMPDPTAINADPNAGRTSTVVTRTAPIEPSGAVGAFYSGVSDDDIASTSAAAAAVAAARADLERAVQEIELAMQVADAAWSGLRADATKFKFGLEADIVTAITDATRAWDGYLAELVEQQRIAKDHDEQLHRELAAEIAITILAGVVTMGFGAAVTAGVFAAKLARWAHSVAAVRAVISSRFAERAAAVARTTAGMHAIRILARSSGDLSTRAVVAGATDDRQLTAQDWLYSLALAGGVGQATSHVAGVALKRVEARYGVRFGAATFGATKGSVQGVPRAGASAVASDAALAAPFALGVPLEAGKEAVGRAMKRRMTALLQADPGARYDALRRLQQRAARNGDEAGLRVPNREIERLIDAELAVEAGRRVDPVLDALVTAQGRGLVEIHRTTTSDPAPAALPTTDGRVPQDRDGTP